MTRFDTTPESVSENARCAPMTSLPSRLTSAPVRVLVKNATGIRWTWSNTGGPQVEDQALADVSTTASASADPTAASATATAAMTNAMSTTVRRPATVHDRVDHPARQHRRRHRQQCADDADRDEAAEPAVVARREVPDPLQQGAVGQRAQVTRRRAFICRYSVCRATVSMLMSSP